MLTWLLPWGGAVEVLEPAALRARLAGEARALLARHAVPVSVPIPAT
jgi:predicted DNA-binding transcriptional regulator YafY